jgi:hypothetical protein
MTDMNTGRRDFNADSDALMGRTAETESTTGHIGEKVREFAHTAQQQAGEQVRTQLDSGKTRAASALRDAAESIAHPNELGADAVNRYIRTASDQVRRAADYLENRDVRQMMSDAEGFARRQPAMFLGGAFMLGLVAARVLKSTRQGGSYGMDSRLGSGSMYDRERSLNSFREPGSQYGGAALGGAGLGDSTLGGSSNRSTTPGTGATGSGGRDTGSSSWTDDLGTTRSRSSDPFANE